MTRSSLVRLVFLALLLSACSDDPELRNSYALITIDGQSLPVELQVRGDIDSLAILEG